MLSSLHAAAQFPARFGFAPSGKQAAAEQHLQIACCVWLWSLLGISSVYLALCYLLDLTGPHISTLPLQVYLLLFPASGLLWYYVFQGVPIQAVLLFSVGWMVCLDWLTATVATDFVGLALMALTVLAASPAPTAAFLLLLLSLRDAGRVAGRWAGAEPLCAGERSARVAVDAALLALLFLAALLLAVLLLSGRTEDGRIVPLLFGLRDEEDLAAQRALMAQVPVLRQRLQNQTKLTQNLMGNIFPKDIVDELLRLFHDEYDPESMAHKAAQDSQMGALSGDASRSSLTTPRANAKTLRAITSLSKFASRIHKYAAILFADLVGFTTHAAHVSPSALVDYLDALFSLFDEVCLRLKVEKIKTIGDCYMCAAWCEDHDNNHAEAANAALRTADSMHAIAPHHRLGDNRISLRAGIHGGTVVGGIIGKTKFCYDIWGDAVNLASRMESTGVPNATQVTQEVYLLLKDQYIFEARDCVTIKGKGVLDTFLVHPTGYCALYPPEPSEGGYTVQSVSSPLPPIDNLNPRRHRLPEGLQSVYDILSMAPAPQHLRGFSPPPPQLPHCPMSNARLKGPTAPALSSSNLVTHLACITPTQV